jgi:hypothetical protein
MKTKFIAVLLILCFALAGLLAVQWNRASQQKTQIEKLQLQVEAASSHERQASNSVVTLQKENQTLRGKLNVSEMELNNTKLAYAAISQMTNSAEATPNSRLASRDSAKSQPANPMAAMAEMMKNPEMKKAMAQQQRMALDMMYGGLFKELNLSKEDTEKLKDLFIEQQMNAMTQGLELMQNSTNRVELAKKAADDQKIQQEKIKELLGEDKYKQYQDYTSTLGERMMLNQFAAQTDAKPDQINQLLAAMKEEKQNMEINQPIGGLAANNEDFQKLVSPELVEQQLDRQKQINQNVLERARQILNPTQFTKFQDQLKNQEAMMELGAKMARGMFQPAAPGPAPTPQ